MSTVTMLYMRSTANRKVVRKFLVPIEVIAGTKPPDVVGLTECDVKSLRNHAKFVYVICSNIATTFPCIFALYVPVMYYLKFDLEKYLINCIVAHIWWHVWVFLSISGQCVTMGYFYVLCMTLRLRVKNYARMLQKMLREGLDCVKLNMIMKYHDDLCRMLYTYNKYWSIHVYSAHQVFLTFQPHN